MEKNLREIARLIGGELCGDGEILISGLSNIPLSRAGDLTFAVPPHLDAAKICAAEIGIAIGAIQVAIGKAHENLTAAQIFALALHRRKNFYDVRATHNTSRRNLATREL